MKRRDVIILPGIDFVRCEMLRVFIFVVVIA
jgi:hypothetical protein